uniref:Reverse transcriptase domain-containing protein n=1 Tax=Tanacetum cinerariifolium TaxID=118510 RepID=A0A699GMX9_TANCI|nr:hypothetical protein [Tanacetum cinerariifolium]
MRTGNSYFPNYSSVTIPRRQNKIRTPNVVKPELRTIVEMVDNRTMEELLQAPTEGYEEAIVIPKINADHFEIKTNLLQLVQENPYHGFERENPHTHINNFKRITSTLKFRDVPNDVIKLIMFPYSLEGNARVWYDKEPPNSILTWEDLTFGEAWERFKEILRACRHHGFTELAQIDTFYNGLNDNDQDSLNVTAGGNLLIVTLAPVKAVKESCVTCGGAHAYYNCPNTNRNQPSVCVATGTYNQVAPQNRASNYMGPPGFAPVQNGQNRFNQNQGQGNNFNRGNNFQPFQVPNQGFRNQPFQVPNNLVQQGFSNEFLNYKKVNDQMMKNMQNQINSVKGATPSTQGRAWKRLKEILRACPHHAFTELAQIDTFYNGLNDNDQDSLNFTARRNLLSNTTREAFKMDDRIDKLADQLSTLVDIFAKKVVTSAPVKAVEESCVTYGGVHSYYNCPNTDSNQPSVCVETGTYNQVAPQNRASNYMAPPGFAPVQNSQNRFIQNQGQGNNFNRGNNFHGNQPFYVPNQGFQNQPLQVPNNPVQQGEFKNEIQNTMKTQQTILMEQQNAFQNNLQNMLSGFFQNQASTLGTLPSNTILNPKGEMKEVTTRSGVAYEGPLIPTPKKVLEQKTNETRDKEQINFQGSTAHIQPLVTPIPKPDVPKTLTKPNIPYPSRLNDQKLHEKATNQMEKFFQIFQDFHFDISFTDALLLMPKFASMIKSLLTNKDKLFELAKIPLNENCSAMLLKKLPEKLGDPGKFLIPCDFLGTDMTLELADRSITRPKGVVEDVFIKVGKFYFLNDFVVVDFEDDPRVPLILERSFLRTGRSLIDVYGEEITLRVNDKAVTFNLNQTTRYFSTYDDLSVNPIDIIDVAREEYAQEILSFSNNSSGGNPTSTSEPILSGSSPSLTPF